MSELTDLEICKRIAEIEGFTFCTGGKYARVEVRRDNTVYGYVDFNPLTDKALCFDLMVKYGVMCKDIDNEPHYPIKQYV